MAVEDWKRDTFDAMNKNVAAHNVLAIEAFTKKTEILSNKNFHGSIDIKQRELLWINRYQAVEFGAKF